MTTATETPKLKAKDFQVPHPNDWCPGCGDFGIINAIQQTFARMGLDPSSVVMVGGIGCSGKAPYYVGSYGVHTLHGRPLPFATGIKLANPELTVIAAGGDGDGLGIGAGHFVNAGRRNVDMTYVLFNNAVYGLTKGQAAPTLPMGLQTKSLAEPNIQMGINPLMMAFASGFTWIGRGYSYSIKELVGLMQRAIEHPGLAYLDVLQPCPTYNNIHTKEWFAGKDLEEVRPRVRPLPEDYDGIIEQGASEEDVFAKMNDFIAMAHEWGDYIPTGVYLENRSVSKFEDRISNRMPSYADASPAGRPIADADGITRTELARIFEELAIN